MTPQQVAADLIAQYNGDSGAALKGFMNTSQGKFSEGKAPNSNYIVVNDILNQLSPIQDEIDRLEVGQRKTKNPIFDGLIFNRVSSMNKLLNEELYENIPYEPFDANRQLHEFEQAIIKLENVLPNVRDKDEREDVIWNIQLLNSELMKLKGGAG